MSLESLLLKKAGLSRKDFAKARSISESQRISMLHAVEGLNLVAEDKLLEIFSEYLKVPKVSLKSLQIPKEIQSKLSKDLCQKFRVVPIDLVGNKLIVAMGDPHNLEALDTIRFKSGFFPKAVIASEMRITEALQKYYGSVELDQFTKDQEQRTNTQNFSRKVIGSGQDKEDGVIIKLVNDILLQCESRGASDIHIESYEGYMRIRLRIDGSLVEIARPPLSLKGPLVSRIKIMSGMNIAEARLPQDGAINIQIGQKPVDFRVNTLPAVFGEKIVMRILDKSNLQVDMTALGFDQDQMQAFKGSIKNPHGMVLVTGPTGSGKTTTLYSALQELNSVETNILTAEDPIEYNLDGINQVQMKSDIGLDFSTALRSFLRQDPDVIMVGEIRDLETAEIAVKAALTGHLVLSTLHTNSASDTISRLLNMGVASFNLVASLNCVTAQRLLKKICERCKIPDDSFDQDHLVRIGIPENIATRAKIYRGKGCVACSNTGTSGRIAVHEVLIMSEDIKKCVIEGLPALEIMKVAKQNGMLTLRQSALNIMLKGLVSAQEVVRVTSSEGGGS